MGKATIIYCLQDELLIKLFKFDPSAEYPDHGSNNETYINGSFLEMETLGPLLNIPAGEMTEHTEHWLLTRGKPMETEESIDQSLLPKVLSFQSSVSHINFPAK